MINNQKIGAVVFAAGRGKRIKAKDINKVMYSIAGVPMIGYTIRLLQKLALSRIYIVVGYLKKSIINYLGNKYDYVVQKKQLGTGHALQCAFKKTNPEISHLLVLNADDSAFYPAKVIKEMINFHLKNKADLTFLTVEMRRPNIARVVRNKKKVVQVVELQNLTYKQQKIKEINCGCYCFSRNFLEQYLSKITLNPIGREYYLPELIEIGLKNKAKVLAYKMKKEAYFQGVNTRNQLLQADKKMKNEF